MARSDLLVPSSQRKIGGVRHSRIHALAHPHMHQMYMAGAMTRRLSRLRLA